MSIQVTRGSNSQVLSCRDAGLTAPAVFRFRANGANDFTDGQPGELQCPAAPGEIPQLTFSANYFPDRSKQTGESILRGFLDLDGDRTEDPGEPVDSFRFTWLGGAPNLQSSIPSPQTLTNGPTTLVAPGTISLRSLKRSKCVLVKVSTNRPARILVSIFSGRRSIRLFGQKLVVFFAPGRKQPCIPVPFRAHTFNVRTPLRVALGYTAGSRPQRSGPKPRPTIKPIRLVP